MTRGRNPEDQRRRRRRRFARTLLLGTAAVGVPAVANALIARRNRRLENPVWGRSRHYSWKEGDVSFQQLGNGSPVVLLHSLGPGYDSEQWRDTGTLIGRSRRVYALDLLGWGRSDKPPLQYDGELYIQLLRDFLDHVVREPATIVGAGLGASYAVQVAADAPEIVEALGLVSPVGLDTPEDEPDLTDALTNRVLRLPLVGTTTLNLYTSRTAIARHLRREVYATPDRADAARIEHHYRSSHQPGSHYALAALLSGYLNHGIESSVSRLDLPIWLAWGRLAANPRVESADIWLNRLGKADLDVFDRVGQLPHLEAPQVFAERFISFLDRIPNR
jgi:pimeloyl-ACP methyl ester carboxylesterase